MKAYPAKSHRDHRTPRPPRLARFLQAAVAAALLLPGTAPARAAAAAVTVSPGVTAGSGESITGACPTFSWTLGAPGTHELVVYELDGAGGEPAVVLSLDLPAAASSWSPGRQDCLKPGGRYAWTVRARGGEGTPAGGWAEPALFRVASAPSQDEVAHAIEVLRRHLEAGGEPELQPSAAENGNDRRGSDREVDPAERITALAGGPSRNASSLVRRPAQAGSAAPLAPAAAPTLGSPSLTISDNLALGSASNVFKGGEPLLWNDTSGNTALGRRALHVASGDMLGNTALGSAALEHTVDGGGLHDGYWNTGVGANALALNRTGRGNTAVGGNSLIGNVPLSSNTGDFNTAIGFEALFDNSSGSMNTVIGRSALANNTEGQRNVAVGYRAGTSVSGPGRDDNIFIANNGLSTDTAKIRIGNQGTQDATFIAGISGATTGQAGGDVVLVDSNGQLGTASCGTYVAVATCPIGNVDGPSCDRVPTGSFCESDDECGASDDLNNCAGFDWYLRTD